MGGGLKAKKSAGSLTPPGFCSAEKQERTPADWEEAEKICKNPSRVCKNLKKSVKTPDFGQGQRVR
jgi:hypothetical protein